jgi:hypothetical protein
MTVQIRWMPLPGSRSYPRLEPSLGLSRPDGKTHGKTATRNAISEKCHSLVEVAFVSY